VRRIKDIYDVYLISNFYPAKMSEIYKEWHDEKRKSIDLKSQKVIVALDADIWGNLEARYKEEGFQEEFRVVILRVKDFVSLIYESLARGYMDDFEWDPHEGRWIICQVT
jgi:hypothetical protein